MADQILKLQLVSHQHISNHSTMGRPTNWLADHLSRSSRFLTGTKVENIKKLQVLQNKGLRSVLNRDIDTGTEELHAEANILKLKHRREQPLLNFMFDMSNVKGNVKKRRKEGMSTRSQKFKSLRVVRPTLEKFRKSSTYQGPKIWNRLPGPVRELDSRVEYKNQIKCHMDLKAKGKAQV